MSWVTALQSPTEGIYLFSKNHGTNLGGFEHPVQEDTVLMQKELP